MTKMPKKIVRFPSPVLRKKAKPVKRITQEILKIIKNMESAMRQAPGIGLAAPQIGESLRLVVADIGEGLHILINPKIIEKSGKQSFVEGCLSLPGVEAPVERAAKVTIKFMDKNGESKKLTVEGLLATVFQHEIDHLEGYVFIDRVKDPSQIQHVPLSKDLACRQAGKKEELI